MSTRYKWNFDFFKQRNELTAYWAGFIMADGCVMHKGANSAALQIILHKQDEDHLHKWSSAIEINDNPISITKSIYRRVTIQNTSLKNDLNIWGIVPRKTYNFVEPNIPLNLIPHFLRGWFDGDGHFSNSKSGVIKITGNKQSLEWYKDQLVLLDIDSKISNSDKFKNKVYTELCIHKKTEVIKFIEFLKPINPDLCLTRKWDKLNSWMEDIKNKEIELNLFNAQLIQLYDSGLSSYKIAEIVNLSPSGVWNKLSKLGHVLRPKHYEISKTHRTCSKCRDYLPIDRFCKNSKDKSLGHNYVCRSCTTIQRREERSKKKLNNDRT